MKKSLKRNLLLLCGLMGDLYTELSRDTLYKRARWLDYQPKSIASTIYRLSKVGDISKEINSKGEMIYRFQARGDKILDEVVILSKIQNKKWDGKWRMVIFDIPEEKRRLRNIIREKLRNLGFGRWQKSVYVTSHDIEEEMNQFLQEKRLFPQVVCFESQRTGYGDDREFADVIFKTDELNEKYEELVFEEEELKEKLKKNQIKNTEFNQQLKRLWISYQDLIISDPFLPQGLLPKPWYYHEAKKILQNLFTISEKL